MRKTPMHVVKNNHPLVLTLRGHTLPTELRALVSEADAVLVVGSKLGAVRTGDGRLPLPVALAHIDIDPAEIGRNYPVALGVVADARLALDALLEAFHDLPDDRSARANEIALI